MNRLNEHSWIEICRFLGPMDILNLLLSLNFFKAIFSSSATLIRKFTLFLDERNFHEVFKNQSLLSIKFKNLSINCAAIDPKNVSIILRTYKNSIDNLSLSNVQSYEIISNGFYNFCYLKSLSLENCMVCVDKVNPLLLIKPLKSILFHNCDENVIKSFENQVNIEKVTICSYKYTYNGFPHDEFNNLLEKLTNLSHLVLDGDGTSSYFDVNRFPFKVKILETTSITFNFYVGLINSRIDFLKSQLGFLKELTIHKLPFDFDGNEFLKFIIEEMQLTKFYYGKIPLILKGTKQEIKDFSATETQVKSAFEMFRQFGSIRKFSLILNNIDICSDEIENVINPDTDLFSNLEEYKLIDKSELRGLFGVFLGFYQKLINIKKLTFDTQDKNIEVILEESLPYMRNLEEICLTSNAKSRFEIIKKLVGSLKKLIVPKDLMPIAKQVFEDQIEILEICY
ncbi:hypothetical protein ACKWTF_010170 [Chironomus riparius]